MTDVMPSQHAADGRPLPGVKLDPHRVIRASAGAGKTYQLTLRYLRLLAAGAEPETILATTFTRKAAGEILARVLGRLAAAADDEQARAELSRDMGVTLREADCRKLLAQLVQRLHRLAISTIDSFFNRIASTFRFELDLPLDPQVMDEGHPVARQLRVEAIEAMLADHQDLPALLDLLRRLHHDTAARPVMQAIDGIVSALYDLYRQVPQQAVWDRLAIPAGSLDGTALVSAVERLAEAAAYLPDDKRWIKAHGKSRDAALAHEWDAFLDTGLSKAIANDKSDYYKKPFPPELLGAYLPLVEHARADQVVQLRNQTLATHHLLRHFDEHYTRLRSRNQVVLFSDLTHKLARELPMLGDALLMEIYFRLDAQVSHLLLDEFQDTSLDQWRVLAPFAEEIQAHGDDPNQSGRSFFCVGDTKQAIYGWRGGCAELFDEVEAGFPGASLPLSVSWRSSPVVLEAVNQVFEGLHQCAVLDKDAAAVARWQEGFETHEPAEKNRRMPGYVRLMTSRPLVAADGGEEVEDEQEDDEQMEDSPHESFVAEQVRAIHEQAPGRRIAVLMSTNKAAHRMIYALRKLELTVSGEGGNPLTDCPAINAVLSALTLADHPGHTAAAFHVANSPMRAVVGLNTTAAGAREEVALRIRRSLLSDGYAATLAKWVRQLASSCDARSLTRLMQLVDLAEQFVPAMSLRPSQFVAYVEATNVEEPTPASIRVMTIHAAKGLEFDVVVLGQLDRRLQRRWEVLVDRPHPTGEIEAVYRNPAQTLRDQIAQLEKPYEAQREQERREDLSNLYVAMTRAKHALHMIVPPLTLTKTGKPRSIGLCFAAMLRDTLAETDDHMQGAQVLYERGDADWASQLADDDAEVSDATAEAQAGSGTEGVLKVTLAEPAAGSRRAWVTVSPSSLGHAGHVRGSDLLNLEGGQARLRGTLMHAWFEHVGFVEAEQTDLMPEQAALRDVARQVAPGASEAWVDGQMIAFGEMLSRPAVKAMFERNGASDLWRERRFVVADQGRMLSGQFDRVAVWCEGERAVRAMLVDFKTDRVDRGRVESLVEVYRPQVEAYRRAIAQLLKIDVSAVAARLVFVEAGEVVSI